MLKNNETDSAATTFGFGDMKGRCKPMTMIDSSREVQVMPNEKLNMYAYSYVQVDDGGAYIHASEDEVIGVQHLLEEPKCNKDLVDGILGFSEFHSRKSFEIEDFPCSVDFDEVKINHDALDSNLARQQKAVLEFPGGRSQGSDVLHETTNVANAELSDKVSDLGYSVSQESCLRNLGSETQPNFCGRDVSREISWLSTADVPNLKFACDQNGVFLDKMSSHELREAFRNMFGRETAVTDEKWLKRRISFGLQNFVESKNGLKPMECSYSSKETEGELVAYSNEFSGRASTNFASMDTTSTLLGDQDGHLGEFSGLDSLNEFSSEISKDGFDTLDSGRKGEILTEKRSRRPTRRYIEESLVQYTKFPGRKGQVSRSRLGEKLPRGRPRKQHYPKGIGAAPARKKPFEGSCIQVPFGDPIRKGHPKKHATFMEDDSEDLKESSDEDTDTEDFQADLHNDMSEDDCVTKVTCEKGRSRRKHHRLWTLSEVLKLIEGVSKYGVGRWTDIKRMLFATSAHRTSVDLKKPLMCRTNGEIFLELAVHSFQARESLYVSSSSPYVEQGRKHASRPMPQSVQKRVRELSIIYPYPRERKSKVSCNIPVKGY
ncbi:hypothetical protein RJ641_008470 [Dillenia turbinata]|uniref:Myb-like domain-containing protein n=1 Tax=Dillenia turbinata TaxID=194707 RepID=A0AAN8VAZ1_9MAGN